MPQVGTGLRCHICNPHRSTNPVLQKRDILVDAHGFEISIGSLISVFQSRCGRQINVVGFNVDLWCLPILDSISSIYDIATEGNNVPKGKGVSP
jgi:hypothetical protein